MISKTILCFLITLVAVSCVSMECYISATQLSVHLNDQLKNQTYENVKAALTNKHTLRMIRETIKLCGGNKTAYNTESVVQCNLNLIESYQELKSLNHSISGLSFTETMLKMIIFSNNVSKIMNNTRDSCRESFNLVKQLYFQITGQEDPTQNNNIELLGKSKKKKEKKGKKEKKEDKEDKEETNEYSKYYKDYYSQGLLLASKNIDPFCEQAAIIQNEYCLINLCEQINQNDCQKFCQDQFDAWVLDCLL